MGVRRPIAEHLRQSAALCKGLIVALFVSLPGAVAHANGDFSWKNTDWNGLSDLVTVAEGQQLSLNHPDAVDLGTLKPADAILILHPTVSLPVRDLSAFLRDGGRIALADDFGTGDELFAAYNIAHGDAHSDQASHYRDNSALPIAEATQGHTLTDGLHGVVTNHPTELHHPGLTPLLTFPGSPSALMLSGAVGKGRLLVLGDPSIFINEMMAFHDNKRLAGRILEYLAAGGGRVFLVTDKTAWTNRYGDSPATPWARMNTWLKQALATPLPPSAVRLLSATVVAILLLMASTALPRRTPYRAARMFPIPLAEGGDGGRIRYYAGAERDLLWPAMLYKAAFEDELVKRLALDRPVLLKAVTAQAERRGLDKNLVARMKDHLILLDATQAREGKGERVTAAEFRTIVENGEKILAEMA